MGSVKKRVWGMVLNMRKVQPHACDAVIYSESIYFFDNCIGAICRANLKSYSLDIFNKCDICKKVYVKKICKAGSCLIMQNGYTADVILWDEITHKYEFCESRISKDIMHSMVQIGGRIYFIPLYWNGKYVVFDVLTRKHFELVSGQSDEDVKYGEMALRPFALNDSILFPSHEKSAFYQLCLENRHFKMYSFSDQEVFPYIAANNDKEIWVLEKNQKSVYKSGEQPQRIDIPLAEYGNMRVLQDHVCLMQKGEGGIVIISKNDLRVNAIKTCDFCSAGEIAKRKVDITGYVNCIEDKDFIYFIPNGYGKMIRVDKTKFIPEICSYMSDEYFKRWKKELFDLSGVIIENPEQDLDWYLSLI